jgi:protein-S-isoprenylcysteine O-methyltransferase Ste14
VRPLPFVWPYALVYWVIYIVAFFPEWKIIRDARVSAQRDGSKDKGSIDVIIRVTWIALMIAYPVAFIRSWMFSTNMLIPLFVLGTLMTVFGAILRRFCWRTLGRYFTGDVQASADQPVIREGPYRFVRHPAYTGGMMMFVGIGFALGNWMSLILLTVATIVAYGYRVAVEERALVDAIGAPYAAYMKERKRFIPFVV